MVKKYLLALLFVGGIIWISTASVGSPPKVIITYSENKEYMLKIYPRQYLNIQLPNQTRRQQKRVGKKIDFDMHMIACYAVLYHISGLETTEIWIKILVNYGSPFTAIVANDGKSVVMIDDWFSRGFSHTIVIYDENGEMIRDFSLEDISPFSLEQYSALISGRYWGSHAEYLDNNRVEIRFRNKNGEEKTRVFNIEERAFEDEISISLQ